jgi:hypothetical protein
MKYILIILIEFLILVDSGVRDFKFRPNLPLVSKRSLINEYELYL